MSPAAWPREAPLLERLLVIDPARGSHEDARVGDLPRYLAAGDLLVVNDAATIPASFSGETPSGARVEVRLLGREGKDARRWNAVLFGDGDWRTRTEHRPAPPALPAGTRVVLGPGFSARVASVKEVSPRFVVLAFELDEDALWPAIYRHGRPVQYAHVAAALPLWHAQTRYAARPWAVELPSAGRPLTWALLGDIARRGVEIVALTHAAGLSSTGDPRVDGILPLPERYDIPQATVDAVRAAKRRRGRVVAVGTTVVRALEGCARDHAGALVAGEGTTDLLIDAALHPRVVDGLFTGLHEPSASHFRLLQAFAPERVLAEAYAHAEREGYLNHEFGDSSLILRGADAQALPA